MRKQLQILAPVIASLGLAVALVPSAGAVLVPSDGGAGALPDVLTPAPATVEEPALTDVVSTAADVQIETAPPAEVAEATEAAIATEGTAATATVEVEHLETAIAETVTINGITFVGCSYDAPTRTFTASYNTSYQAFSLFGDLAWYALLPQGDFESIPSWQRSGKVSLAPGSPFGLAGADHQRSVRLQSGGWLRTPPMCVSLDTPHARMVATAVGSRSLEVETRLYGCSGRNIITSRYSLPSSEHSVWAVSRKLDLNTTCLGPGKSGIVDVRFRTDGDWSLDDLMIDPYKRG